MIAAALVVLFPLVAIIVLFALFEFGILLAGRDARRANRMSEEWLERTRRAGQRGRGGCV